MYSLFYNTTGYLNTANGYMAGRFTAVGNNETSNKSIYLGASTKALADGDTNEIVIGYNATGAGSNSVVLGNDSITKTVLKGDVQTEEQTQTSLSADPTDPDAGNSVQWVSDGTGSGDAGDVMMKINVAGVVKTTTLIDYSTL